MASPPGTHYDILGLAPTASFEQIERAYRYHIAIYSDSALATYSLLDPNERQQTRAQIQEAYDTLKDALRRRTYDASIGVQPPMTAASVALDEGGAPPPARASALDGPVTGARLRRFR